MIDLALFSLLFNDLAITVKIFNISFLITFFFIILECLELGVLYALNVKQFEYTTFNTSQLLTYIVFV